MDLKPFTGVPPRIDQPALSENLLCMHLGGPKHVRRWCEGRGSAHDIDLGSLTIVPAGQANGWLTRGPVDFGLIAVNPALLCQIAVEEFDREPLACALHEAVGMRAPALEALFQALLLAADRPGAAGRLYPESLLVVLAADLLENHSFMSDKGRANASAAMAPRGGLPPWRLRRVIDYMVSHMAEDIGLVELTALAGLSRAQFFRAFKQSTGSTPHRYLATLRLNEASVLLAGSDLSLDEVAAAVGLTLPGLTGPFRRQFGVTPKIFRRVRREDHQRF